jgi:hypothetical protein
MPSSNFVVSSLPDYVQNNKDLIIKNFALVGTASRQRFGLQTGIKTSAYLNYLELNPTLQDGKGCGFSASGTATLTQRTITTAIIKVNMDICPDSLLGKYAEYLVRIGAKSDELPFEQYIIDGITAELNKKIEKLIWQGDTTKTTDTDLKWINGILKQLASDADKVAVSIANGTAIYNAIKAVYLAIPEETLERGAEIYISPANYRDFLQAMVEKNYFHYSGPQDAAPEEFVFPGTDVKVVKTPGLAGVNNLIVASFPENFVYGCDAEGDLEEVKIWFSDDDDLFKLKVKWNSGIAYRFPNQVTLGTIASS